MIAEGRYGNIVGFGNLEDRCPLFSLDFPAIESKGHHFSFLVTNWSFYDYRFKLARLIADSAVDTFFLVNGMRFFLLAVDSFLWALSKTDVAAVAFFLVYLVVEEPFTNSGPALLLMNVL